MSVINGHSPVISAPACQNSLDNYILTCRRQRICLFFKQILGYQAFCVHKCCTHRSSACTNAGHLLGLLVLFSPSWADLLGKQADQQQILFTSALIHDSSALWADIPGQFAFLRRAHTCACVIIAHAPASCARYSGYYFVISLIIQRTHACA